MRVGLGWGGEDMSKRPISMISGLSCVSWPPSSHCDLCFGVFARAHYGVLMLVHGLYNEYLFVCVYFSSVLVWPREDLPESCPLALLFSTFSHVMASPSCVSSGISAEESPTKL